MITDLDDQVGRIIAELDKKGLRDNTIILLASDNGGATSGLFAQGAKSKEERAHEEGGIDQGAKAPASNAPFRGGKGSLYEGGVRVPAIVNWPGKLKPAVVNEPVHMVDVMPTLLALAGGKGDWKLVKIALLPARRSFLTSPWTPARRLTWPLITRTS